MNAECPVCEIRVNTYAVAQHAVRDATPEYAPEALRCPACGAVFLWPPLDPESRRRFHAGNAQIERTLGRDFDWNDYVQRTRPDTMRRLRLMQPLLHPSDRLLELGCGYGFFLSLIKEGVQEAIGVEPGHARRSFGRDELGLDIREPSPEAAGIRPGSVDVACAFQVLEHIGRPRQFLAEIFDVLKPGGLLVLEVPNYADAYVSLLPSYRAYHFQTAHAIYYTPDSLRYVLESSGLAVSALTGVQRYAIGNAWNWALRGKPQRRAPAREAGRGAAAILDRAYRSILTHMLRCDTLICLATKPQQQRETT